jgi:hypothetical protein
VIESFIFHEFADYEMVAPNTIVFSAELRMDGEDKGVGEGLDSFEFESSLIDFFLFSMLISD